MSNRAEAAALKAYPVCKGEYSDSCDEYDTNEADRITYIEGYEQAEKDLALTWEDARKIVDIYFKLLYDKYWNTRSLQEAYSEVLRRFNEQKNK